MSDPALRDATIVRKALSGDIIDLKAATEVICSRTSTQIQHVKQIYRARFNAYLEHDIEYQATGDLKKVLALPPSLSALACYIYLSPSVTNGHIYLFSMQDVQSVVSLATSTLCFLFCTYCLCE